MSGMREEFTKLAELNEQVAVMERSCKSATTIVRVVSTIIDLANEKCSSRLVWLQKIRQWLKRAIVLRFRPWILTSKQAASAE